jgi:hypothetical protein
MRELACELLAVGLVGGEHAAAEAGFSALTEPVSRTLLRGAPITACQLDRLVLVADKSSTDQLNAGWGNAGR